MKLTLLEQITAGLNQQIAEAQALLAYLRKYGTDHPAEAAAPAAPLKTRKPITDRQRIKIGKAASKRAGRPAPANPATTAPKSGVALPGDEPQSIGGAMKFCILKTPKFTSDGLREFLTAQFPKIAAMDDFGLRFTANLSNWRMTGKLARDAADVFTIVNHEFFAAAS